MGFPLKDTGKITEKVILRGLKEEFIFKHVRFWILFRCSGGNIKLVG